MALPLSKNQLQNLGKRLRDASAPAPEDLDLLSEVFAAYDEAMVTASDLLSGLGLPPSARLENTDTVIEKLRRDHATHPHSIQDLAGLRVFVDDSGGRRRQDEVVALISVIRAGDLTSHGSSTVRVAQPARCSNSNGSRWPTNSSTALSNSQTCSNRSNAWKRKACRVRRQPICGSDSNGS